MCCIWKLGFFQVFIQNISNNSKKKKHDKKITAAELPSQRAWDKRGWSHKFEDLLHFKGVLILVTHGKQLASLQTEGQ